MLLIELLQQSSYRHSRHTYFGRSGHTLNDGLTGVKSASMAALTSRDVQILKLDTVSQISAQNSGLVPALAEINCTVKYQ